MEGLNANIRKQINGAIFDEKLIFTIETSIHKALNKNKCSFQLNLSNCGNKISLETLKKFKIFKNIGEKIEVQIEDIKFEALVVEGNEN